MRNKARFPDNLRPQSTGSETHLTFKLLEDVMLLTPHRYQQIVNDVDLLRIGPLVEYAYHHYEDSHRHFRPSCTLGRYFQTTFQAIKLNQVLPDSTTGAKQVEFFKPPGSFDEAENPHWLCFCRRLADAALKAGLSKEFSYALAGTFEEMTGNVIEHSENSATGLVGYRWKSGEFEYVVADSGIGVLQSLRTHPDFAWIADSGEALERAVCDGVSRHGLADHRGTGFHDLIFNIANRNSYLRFRSGDHVYVVDGMYGLPRKSLRPCAQLQGLLVSVVSHPLSPS